MGDAYKNKILWVLLLCLVLMYQTKIYYRNTGQTEFRNFDLGYNSELTKINHKTYDREVNSCKTKYFDGEYVLCTKKEAGKEIVYKMINFNYIVNTNYLLNYTENIERNGWYDFEYTCLNQNIKSDKCKNIEGDKVCVFLHGSGESITADPTDTFYQYWGHIEKYTGYCKKRIFIHEETKNRGWDNIELQKSYCTVAQNATTIFSHSMGSLVLAAAIRNGCNIQNKTWYDLGGPFFGSKAALFLDDICSSSNSTYRYIADHGGYCIPGKNKTYMAYLSLRPNYGYINELYSFARPFITGSLCGVSSFGLNSKYSLFLYLLSTVVDYGEQNDGMVALSSCSIFGNSSSNPTDLFYTPLVNHADITCRNGDGFRLYSSPCTYFINKV